MRYNLPTFYYCNTSMGEVEYICGCNYSVLPVHIIYIQIYGVIKLQMVTLHSQMPWFSL